jgi:hypothetical protein
VSQHEPWWRRPLSEAAIRAGVKALRAEVRILCFLTYKACVRFVDWVLDLCLFIGSNYEAGRRATLFCFLLFLAYLDSKLQHVTPGPISIYYTSTVM